MAQRAGDSGPEQALSPALLWVSLPLFGSTRKHCRSASRTTQAESQLIELTLESVYRSRNVVKLFSMSCRFLCWGFLPKPSRLQPKPA